MITKENKICPACWKLVMIHLLWMELVCDLNYSLWGGGFNCSNCKQRVHSWKNCCRATQVIRWEAHKQVSRSFPLHYTIFLSVGFSASASHGATWSSVGFVTCLCSVKSLWGNDDEAAEVRIILQLWFCVSPSNRSFLSYVCSDPMV